MSKTLTPDEVLRVAVAHIVNGIDQHHLASLMGVNQGRVSEAVTAIDWAMRNHMTIYKITQGKAHIATPIEAKP